MASVEFDTSELRAFAVDLGKAPGVVTRGVPAVVFKGAMNIKEDQRRAMAASEHFGQVAPAIDFDTRGGVGFFEAEIGPRKGSPGSLANIAYWGDAHGAGTVEDPGRALDREEPRFTGALEALAAKALP